MKFTASKIAIELIMIYCTKYGIAFKQRNNKTIYFEEITDTLRSYFRGVLQVNER